MAAPKPNLSVHKEKAGGRQSSTGPSLTAAAFIIGSEPSLPKGTTGFKFEIPKSASGVLTRQPEHVKALLQGYGDAIAKSVTAGQQVSFRVDVDPKGRIIVTPLEETFTEPEVLKESVPVPALQVALAAARERGRLRAAEILSGDDMMSAEAFATMLGTTRVTVNAKRQSGQVLGLDGAKRGFRFPVWQLDADGKPYAALSELHERLGGAWAVYRFLLQPHGELDGLTGREALERGKSKAALEAAESVGRDFR
jgi:hypothetical protein